MTKLFKAAPTEQSEPRSVRLRPSEWRLLEAVAAADGVSTSRWLREAALHMARTRLIEDK